MTKYRILKIREGKYAIQKKFFDLFWITVNYAMSEHVARMGIAAIHKKIEEDAKKPEVIAEFDLGKKDG